MSAVVHKVTVICPGDHDSALGVLIQAAFLAVVGLAVAGACAALSLIVAWNVIFWFSLGIALAALDLYLIGSFIAGAVRHVRAAVRRPVAPAPARTSEPTPAPEATPEEMRRSWVVHTGGQAA